MRKIGAILPGKFFDQFPTGRTIGSLLPQVLKKIEHSQKRGLNRFFGIWNEIVGEAYACRTKVLKIDGNRLYIKVFSTSLYSLLAVQEKDRLIKEIKKKAPFLKVETIVFRR